MISTTDGHGRHRRRSSDYSSDFSDVTRPAVTVLQIDVCSGMGGGGMAHASACDSEGSEGKTVALAGW